VRRRLPPLVALRAFEAAGRLESFTAAAGELNVTQGAVSRHVRTLEEFLGKKLFVRNPRQVELTEPGRDYLAAVQGGLDQIESATTRLFFRSARAVLTVSILPTLASLWLMPRLASFTQAYRDIEVRLITSIEPADLRATDAAIRVGRLPGKRYAREQPRIDLVMVSDWSGVEADLLFPDVLTPIVSRRMLEQGPRLRSPGDLAKHRLIHVTTRRHAWPDWLRAQGHAGVTGSDSLDFGHFFMAMQAARESRGVAIVPEVLLRNYEGIDDLAMPLPAATPSAGEYYLLTLEDRADVRAVRLFRNWLLAQAAEPKRRRTAQPT
jgi:LysR family transcriptional regulator, glycine cleavage system transcriptional activator